MAVINIREVPESFARAAKSAALDAGLSLREWVLYAIGEKLGMPITVAERGKSGEISPLASPYTNDLRVDEARVPGEVSPDSEPVPETQATAREHAKAKKARRHAQLKADCLAALPADIPPQMKARMATPPSDHHPACRCFRCQPPAAAAATPVPTRRRLTAGKG